MADRSDTRYSSGKGTGVRPTPAGASTFLDEAPLDWANPAALELHGLLASAYPNVREIQAITSEIGVREYEINWDGAAREVWRHMINLLSRGGRMNDLVTHVLNDPAVTAYHADLSAIRKRPPRGTIDALLGPDELEALLIRVRSDGPMIELSDDESQALRTSDPGTAEQYRLRRIANWREPHLLGRGEDLRRFTRLGLFVDKGESAQMRWSEQERDYNDLRQVVRAAGAQNPVFVLLGEPGAGKTTLLRRIEIELACLALGWADADPDAAAAGPVEGGAAALLPFYLSLAEHRDAAVKPKDWLAQSWKAAHTKMPPLETLLDDQPMILLLDALNEIPYGGARPSYEDRVKAWRDDLHTLYRDHPLIRVIISCRSLDYSTFLSSDALRVPHVLVKRLVDEQIRNFLDVYRPELASKLWNAIRESGQIDIYRTPYYLRLLVDQVGDDGEVPVGRAALFAGFVRQSMLREIMRDNQ